MFWYIIRTAQENAIKLSFFVVKIIVSEKYLPSADILRKLARIDAKPQNGITIEDLMIAAGYQTDYVADNFYFSIENEDSSILVETNSVRERAFDETGNRLNAYSRALWS